VTAQTPRQGPRFGTRGTRIAIIVASLALIYAVVVGVLVLGGGPDVAADGQTSVVLAVGGLAPGGSQASDELRGLLADRRFDALVLLGDLAPPDGSASAWEDQYRATYGSLDASVRPTPGDVEYGTGSAAPYHAYYGRHAGTFASSPYYAFTLGGWRIYSLDSEIQQGDPGSEMYEWLRHDLSTEEAPCVAAFWHRPTYSIGPSEADSGQMEGIFELLSAWQADIVIAGHDGNYQRWAPIGGITSFVVGTGGATPAAPTRSDDRVALSSDASPGLLQLELGPGSAGFRFVRASGDVVDSGRVSCHGRPTSELPRPAVPAGLGSNPGNEGVELSWEATAGDPAAVGYLIYRGSDLIGFTRETSYVDTTLPPGASVLYSVRSVAATGARSRPSEPVHSGGGSPGFTDYVWSAPDENPASPTADKPQSKLWSNDGSWWGILWDADPTRPSHSGYYIQQFDRTAQAWHNTGIEVDERSRSRADALWDDGRQKLYVVSTIDSGAIKLYRYSYANGAYAADDGFPLRLTEDGSESATVAKDGEGRLWVTMTQLADGSGPCQDGQACEVKVMHSTDADYRWTDPFTLPVAVASVDHDDISAVAAFGPGRIAIVLSNQLESAFFVVIHADGDPDSAWEVERLELAPRGSDDHINVKADDQGRLYFIGKTSFNDPANAAPDSPLMVVWVRDPDGTWRNGTAWTVADDVTRAQIVVDEADSRIYAVAAQPGTGGNVFVKRAAIGDLDFGTGLGTVLLSGGHMNNPTLTKQPVSLSDGFPVLASDSNTHTYWHNVVTPELLAAAP
jgi:hypothetical protein